MPTTYHRAASTDGYGWLCPHAHGTVISATACITSAGDYIVALEDGVFRALTQVEQAEYEYAIYGEPQVAVSPPLKVIARSGPHRALCALRNWLHTTLTPAVG